MNGILVKTGMLVRILLIVAILSVFFNVPYDSAAYASPQSNPWLFGVITDTHWAAGHDGLFDPNTSASYLIAQINQQFIRAGVKFVIVPGDLVDASDAAGMGIRALYTQDLYNAGIGFYPLRGNHDVDGNPNSGAELRYAFPQVMDGINNNTPSDITPALIPVADRVNVPPASKTGGPFSVGTNFTEPAQVNAANKGVSYAFQYGNALFMLLDQFDASGDSLNSSIAQQQPWIDTTLSTRPADTHAFVFTHKNILGGNHKDNLFGANLFPADSGAGADPGDGNGMVTARLTPEELQTLTVKQSAANRFLASMQTHQVDFVFTGHDHHHYTSIVTSPDGLSKTRQIIGQSASLKFYPPMMPVSSNDAPIEQDLYKIGYYIVAVDGPRVSVHYYTTEADNHQNGIFNFVKVSVSYYSLNGKEKLVAQSGSYAMSDDTSLAETLERGFKHTHMAILAGSNGSTAITNYGKAINKRVTTAWRASVSTLSSDILSISGMSQALGGTLTDPYVLSMSYTGNVAPSISSGTFGILTRDKSGRWFNAVINNIGTPGNFILGPWDPGYPLGSYGIDPTTRTAWAVLNYNGEFAVGDGAGIYKLFLPISGLR